MAKPLRKYFFDYGAAVVVVAIAVLLRWLLDPMLNERVPHATVYGAVAIVFWLAGLGPALLATILGAVAADWFFVSPRGAVLGALSDYVEVSTYLFSCGIIILFGVRMRAAQRRAEANAGRLETEVAERKKAEQALEAANRGKDEFLAMLSHELRTPLGALVNAVGVLEIVGARGPEAERPREVIKRQVGHLSKLTDDLLDVSRLIAGKTVLNRTSLDMAQAVKDCLQTLAQAGQTARHRLKVEIAPAWIEADPVRLQQILLNLIGNSLKYTPPGGEIRIICQCAGTDSLFEISDTGIGIEPEVLPHVFDLFVQSEHGRNRPRAGMGIGLTVVRRLVELHGGSICVSSEGRGRGATFTMRFPALASPLAVQGLKKSPSVLPAGDSEMRSESA